jgi:undecaprenyl-diphosphatase
MHSFLDVVQSIDLRIYFFFAHYFGNWFVDHLVDFMLGNAFRGYLVVAVYWGVWFRHGCGREKDRTTIIAVVFATMLGVVVTRTFAVLMAFRLRPSYITDLPHARVTPNTMLGQWNSFPSDTATYFWALAFGLIVLLPRFKFLIAAYTTGWICFPRVYLGYHYTSDIVVGAVIGVAVVWAVLKSEWFHSSVASTVAALADSKSGIFYAVAFLISVEMAKVFSDILALEQNLVHVKQKLESPTSYASSNLTSTDSLMTFAAILFLILVAIAILFIRQKDRTGPACEAPRN